MKFPPNLTVLNLEDNQLVSLKGAKFPPYLRNLNLKDNQIETLEISFFPSTLERLELGGNPINEESRARLLKIVNTPGYNDDTGISYRHPLAAWGRLSVGGMKARKLRKTSKARKARKARKGPNYSLVKLSNKTKRHHVRLE